MSVVTSICKNVAIIDNGILVEEGDVASVFEHPKTDAAKELLFGTQPVYSPVEQLNEARKIRIIFNENSAYEPVIANLILKYRTAVNILKADTRNVGGKARGEMILGLPDGEELQEYMIESLKKSGLSVMEVNDDVY